MESDGNNFYASATLKLSVVVLFAVVINASIIVKIFKWQFEPREKFFIYFSPLLITAGRPGPTNQKPPQIVGLLFYSFFGELIQEKFYAEHLHFIKSPLITFIVLMKFPKNICDKSATIKIWMDEGERENKSTEKRAAKSNI